MSLESSTVGESTLDKMNIVLITGDMKAQLWKAT
jgi:hypothetical protein